ncbi:S41 family peptidase [Candidatus Daviesbacteria bacterium]|nr:S41 family peptidase [Candidatus Daviesbacteria bacterium]
MRFFEKINGTAVVFALLAFIIGWQAGHFDVNLQWKNYKPVFSFTNLQPPKEKKGIDFKLFWEVWDLVSKEYVDKKAIDAQKMYYGAIQGMVAALGDPYTVFLPPEAQKSTKEELGGSFEGVGIQLEFNKEKRLVVAAPLKDTPADKAGIKAGDIIVKIDDKDAGGISLPEAVKLIRGPKDTQVKLEIFREGDTKTKEYTLKRAMIVVKSVEFEEKTTPQGKKISYIKLSRFGERTFTEWNETVSQTLASGTEGVILDVRNNPGGFLDGAVFIGSEFIERVKVGSSDKVNDIVLQEDQEGRRQAFKVNREGRLTKLPLVVLVNKGSASASEIVAGAIQDYKRGRLVGEQSFGKGTIQESQELSGDTGIHITTAKWLTPNGRWIHNTGLTPDIKAELDETEEKDEQLEKALELLD